MKRKCPRCKESKEIDDFYPNSLYICKSCLSIQNKKKYSLEKKKFKTYYQENKVRIKKYYLDNKEQITKKIYFWKKKNKDKVRKYKIKENLKKSNANKSKALLDK